MKEKPIVVAAMVLGMALLLSPYLVQASSDIFGTIVNIIGNPPILDNLFVTHEGFTTYITSTNPSNPSLFALGEIGINIDFDTVSGDIPVQVTLILDGETWTDDAIFEFSTWALAFMRMNDGSNYWTPSPETTYTFDITYSDAQGDVGHEVFYAYTPAEIVNIPSGQFYINNIVANPESIIDIETNVLVFSFEASAYGSLVESIDVDITKTDSQETWALQLTETSTDQTWERTWTAPMDGQYEIVGTVTSTVGDDIILMSITISSDAGFTLAGLNTVQILGATIVTSVVLYIGTKGMNLFGLGGTQK